MADPIKACKQLLKVISLINLIKTEKRPKKIFKFNLIDKFKWFLLSILQKIISNKPSKMYFRQQQTIKKYKLAFKIFMIHLFLLIQKLKQDQLEIIFYVTCLFFYNTLNKAEKFTINKVFNMIWLQVNNQLVVKMKKYTKEQ